MKNKAKTTGQMGKGKGDQKVTSTKVKVKAASAFSDLQLQLPMSITSKILAQMRSYNILKKAIKVYFPKSPLAAPYP